MKLPQTRPSRVQRWMQRVAQALGQTPILEALLARVDRAVLALTGGRYSCTGLLTGLPTFLVSTRGARSGLVRATPLLGIVHGEQILLIASNFGKAAHPAWYFNLRAHPEARVTWRGEEGRFIAREAQGEEAQRLLEVAIAHYPGYALYRRRAYPRQIPVLVLSEL